VSDRRTNAYLTTVTYTLGGDICLGSAYFCRIRNLVSVNTESASSPCSEQSDYTLRVKDPTLRSSSNLLPSVSLILIFLLTFGIHLYTLSCVSYAPTVSLSLTRLSC